MASPTTREFTNFELLRQQSGRYFPKESDNNDAPSFKQFIDAISAPLLRFFGPGKLPELIVEPGRCLTSQNQFLLVSVHHVKDRKGARRWIYTDGGLGTCTLPTYYEFHHLFLCNEVSRKPDGPATLIGPCCFAADTIYKDRPMPTVEPGESIAIMDTGAYFNQLESNFGFSRPAIVLVRSHNHSLARHAESFSEMTGRDHFQKREVYHEISG